MIDETNWRFLLDKALESRDNKDDKFRIEDVDLFHADQADANDEWEQNALKNEILHKTAHHQMTIKSLLTHSSGLVYSLQDGSKKCFKSDPECGANYLRFLPEFGCNDVDDPGDICGGECIDGSGC